MQLILANQKTFFNSSTLKAECLSKTIRIQIIYLRIIVANLNKLVQLGYSEVLIQKRLHSFMISMKYFMEKSSVNLIKECYNFI